MSILLDNIDVKENSLRRIDDLLDILLFDNTTRKNIIWATDSYERLGIKFLPKKQIKPELVTGKYGKLIQPRASKSITEQRQRTRDKAEVFTPLSVIRQINNTVDDNDKAVQTINKTNWQVYVCQLKIEIACGEAPFIVSRYNPTAHTRKLIKLKNRVGFLDKKLKIVSQYCNNKVEWLKWAKVAFRSSYGYEWQGDNLLIARENLLYTLIDFYKSKFKSNPSLAIQKEFARIICWNIFQMDGIKYVIPMSCQHETKLIHGESALFWEIPDKIKDYECEGCKFHRITKHNGKYVKIMDWSINKVIEFINLVAYTGYGFELY